MPYPARYLLDTRVEDLFLETWLCASTHTFFFSLVCLEYYYLHMGRLKMCAPNGSRSWFALHKSTFHVQLLSVGSLMVCFRHLEARGSKIIWV